MLSVRLPLFKQRRATGYVLAAHMLLNVYTLPPVPAQETSGGFDLANMSLEKPANIQVTSVSRQVEGLSEAPASISVIAADDIRHSGATTLPEVP
jgi:outer membrane receptor for ferrienterochelin and colicin